MHFAFDEFAHILWGMKKPTIVMTDNKALTRFFQSKRIPPKLWNYCDQALQFDFVLTHVPGVENAAADYLSRIDIHPKDRIHLKLHDEIPVFKVEIDLASKRLSRMMRRKNTSQTRRMCLTQQHHQTHQCSRSWRGSLNGVTKTTNSTVDALTTSTEPGSHGKSGMPFGEFRDC